MNSTEVRHPAVVVLRVLAILGMVAAFGVAVLGTVFIVEDERESTDMWDGLGTFLGLLALGGAVVALLVLGLLFFLLTLRPRVGLWGTAGVATLGLGGTALLAAPTIVSSQGTAPWELAAAGSAGCLVVLGLAVWGLAPSVAGSS